MHCHHAFCTRAHPIGAMDHLRGQPGRAAGGVLTRQACFLQGIYELVNQQDFNNCSPEVVSMQAQPSQADGISLSVLGFVRLKVSCCTVRFESTTKVLATRMLKYYRTSPSAFSAYSASRSAAALDDLRVPYKYQQSPCSLNYRICWSAAAAFQLQPILSSLTRPIPFRR